MADWPDYANVTVSERRRYAPVVRREYFDDGFVQQRPINSGITVQRELEVLIREADRAAFTAWVEGRRVAGPFDVFDTTGPRRLARIVGGQYGLSWRYVRRDHWAVRLTLESTYAPEAPASPGLFWPQSVHFQEGKELAREGSVYRTQVHESAAIVQRVSSYGRNVFHYTAVVGNEDADDFERWLFHVGFTRFLIVQDGRAWYSMRVVDGVGGTEWSLDAGGMIWRVRLALERSGWAGNHPIFGGGGGGGGGGEDDGVEIQPPYCFLFPEVEERIFVLGKAIENWVLPEVELLCDPSPLARNEIRYALYGWDIGLRYDEATRTLSGTPAVLVDPPIPYAYIALKDDPDDPQWVDEINIKIGVRELYWDVGISIHPLGQHIRMQPEAKLPHFPTEWVVDGQRVYPVALQQLGFGLFNFTIKLWDDDATGIPNRLTSAVEAALFAKITEIPTGRVGDVQCTWAGPQGRAYISGFGTSARHRTRTYQGQSMGQPEFTQFWGSRGPWRVEFYLRGTQDPGGTEDPADGRLRHHPAGWYGGGIIIG